MEIPRKEYPFVSVVVPCRNEEKHIETCICSIIRNDFPKEKLEILVVDGISEDRTRKIIEKYRRKYSFIRLLDNPREITACGLNKGIKESRGEFILWMSAHNKYDRKYISECLDNALEFNADNVGGIIRVVPRNDSLLGRSIAFALSHPFGVGNSPFRTGIKKRKWVDTVFGGCYKREVFEKIGLFNEDLSRGQDMEFNLRMRRVGYRTLLVPEIVSYYYARSDLRSYIRYNFVNGLWAILPMKFVPYMPVAGRHLVPLLFVATLVVLGILSSFSMLFLGVLMFVLASYFITGFYFSRKIAIDGRDWRYLFVMPPIFGLLHICYGLGSLWGFFSVMGSRGFWENRCKHLVQGI
jgi:glycosyltransferase involved in cell wall biosynthesis